MHVALLTMGVLTDALAMLSEHSLRAVVSGVVYVFPEAALLLGRVALHRMNDQAAAQRVGGIAWTCFNLGPSLLYVLDGSMLLQSCSAPSSNLLNVNSLLYARSIFVYMNASQPSSEAQSRAGRTRARLCRCPDRN